MKFLRILLLATTIAPYQVRLPLGGLDSAYLVSNAADASGTNRFCNAVLMGSVYECQILAVEQAAKLSVGMVITFVSTTANPANPSLDLGYGPNALVNQMGTVLAAAFIQPSIPHLLYFDGTNWRLLV